MLRLHNVRGLSSSIRTISPGHDWLGWAYVKQRRYPEAIAEREKVVELSQEIGPTA